MPTHVFPRTNKEEMQDIMSRVNRRRVINSKIVGDNEKIYLEIASLAKVIMNPNIDWTTTGAILSVLLSQAWKPL